MRATQSWYGFPVLGRAVGEQPGRALSSGPFLQVRFAATSESTAISLASMARYVSLAGETETDVKLAKAAAIEMPHLTAPDYQHRPLVAHCLRAAHRLPAGYAACSAAYHGLGITIFGRFR